MKVGRKFIAVVFLFLVLTGVVVFFIPKEPRYEGRSLTSWLQECNNTGLLETQRLAQAQTAIRAMPFKKVLPRLLTLAKSTDDPLSLWIMGLTDKFRIAFLKWHPAADFQQLAVAGP